MKRKAHVKIVWDDADADNPTFASLESSAYTTLRRERLFKDLRNLLLENNEWLFGRFRLPHFWRGRQNAAIAALCTLEGF